MGDETYFYLTSMTKYAILNISGQGLPKEPGKHMWLTKAYTSQEAPSSTTGSSSLS